MDQLEADLHRVFTETWALEKGGVAPVLTHDSILLDTGLDSMGFAIFVSNLEDAIGYDPFSISQDPYYPQTFGDFVAFYAKYHPDNFSGNTIAIAAQ